jgi:hypothetical protein
MSKQLSMEIPYSDSEVIERWAGSLGVKALA